MPNWILALFQYHVAAGAEHERVLKLITNIQTVVDIGANRGQFALVARHCFPKASIISFEPLEEPASIYNKVFSKDSRTRLIEKAIGPESGEATIHLSERDDSSSLLPITKQQNLLFPGTKEAGTQTIRVTRLADELTKEQLATPALLKLDVQGFELASLSGCEELLNHFDWVYVECSFVELYEGQSMADEVIAWLRQRGILLCGVYNMSYDKKGRAIQADFLFRHIEKNQDS